MLSRQSDDVGLAEVAERVGYASASTFSTAFSRHVGLPPGSLRAVNTLGPGDRRRSNLHRNEVDWGVKAAGNAPPLRLPLPAANLCAIY
jgi:AraC-like DNA-binding protein